MEDYKEKYEQALERAKGAHNSAKSDKENCVTDKITEYTIQLTETIFPELRESEDDRIRKELVEFVNQYGDNFYGQIAKASTIAWLEKQGEHANFRNKIQIGDEVTRNEDGVLVNLSQFNRVVKKDGRQCEQKPTDKVEPKFKVGDVMRTLQEASDGFTDGMPVVVSIDDEYYHCTNELIAIKNQDNYEYPPINKKHNDWSEEDERMLGKAISTIRYALSIPLDSEDDSCFAGSSTISWLKSLKDRVQPQIKQKWSEEDEIGLGNAMWAIEQARTIAKDVNDMGNLWSAEWWLKSLKERYTWKPSDEQMKQLGWVAEQNKENMIGKELMSLYQDLKKLKEE